MAIPTIPTPLKGSDHRRSWADQTQIVKSSSSLVKSKPNRNQYFVVDCFCRAHNACDECATLAVQVLRLLSSVPRRGGGDGVGTHQNTWDSCISPSMHTAAHCTAIHQISIPTPQNVAMLLKLRLLTLGEYKFGINWFSAKMWSVKPRKIKTPGGELCHVQLTLYLTLVTLFTLYLILVTLFTLYLTQVTLCAQSQFWWYVTTTPHLLLLLQCTSSILHHLSPRCELKFLFVSTTDICWGQNWRYVFVFVFVFVFVVEVLL